MAPESQSHSSTSKVLTLDHTLTTMGEIFLKLSYRKGETLTVRLEESLKDAEGDLAEESFAEASMTHVRSASKVMGVDYLSSLTCGLLRHAFVNDRTPMTPTMHAAWRGGTADGPEAARVSRAVRSKFIWQAGGTELLETKSAPR